MASNPFNPAAANPRYLAGREREKAALADLLNAGAQSPVGVVFAPRGNGKTALAHWLERAAEAAGILVRSNATPARAARFAAPVRCCSMSSASASQSLDPIVAA